MSKANSLQEDNLTPTFLIFPLPRPSSPLSCLPSPLARTTWPGLRLLWPNRVQHDLVGRLLSVCGVALAPVVANSIGKDIPVPIEGSTRYGTTNTRVTFETVFGILVPEVKCTVATGGAESPMDWVETNRIDRVNVADIAVALWSFTVTFEGEVRRRVLLFDILNGTATFNTADCKP